MPTEGVDFDTGDFVMEGSAESFGATPTAADTMGSDYTPPATATTTGEPSTLATTSAIDPELGGEPQTEPPLEPSIVSVVSSLPPPPTSTAEGSSTIPAPLLDSHLPAELNELD